MSDLKQHLIKLIKLHGPLPISSYMIEALTNPKYGYYVKQNPFGSKGDFITAPEVSQMFGELIGLWFADIWLKKNNPAKIHLIELGPGKGTLMADILRALKILPDFLSAIELHFVEASPQLSAMQKETLRDFSGKISWHTTVKEALNATKVENEPSFIVANEFFDALPIRQFQKSDMGWHERMVTVDKKDDQSLIPLLSPDPVENVKLPEHLNNAKNNSVVETSPMTEHVIYEICNHIKQQKGAALFIDYGYTEHGTGETLQAVENHKYADVFENPGFADLSAHVNFRKICDIIEQTRLIPHGPITQGQFLRQMGIEERAKALSKQASQEQVKDIEGALKRLISPDEMGELFKVIAITASNDFEVTGF